MKREIQSTTESVSTSEWDRSQTIPFMAKMPALLISTFRASFRASHLSPNSCTESNDRQSNSITCNMYDQCLIENQILYKKMWTLHQKLSIKFKDKIEPFLLKLFSSGYKVFLNFRNRNRFTDYRMRHDRHLNKLKKEEVINWIFPYCKYYMQASW